MHEDSAVPSHLIDVTTRDGIVTLTGSVDNILAKERAARLARIVKGVRAVINKIDVALPAPRGDRLIREDVEDALRSDPAVSSHRIDVSVQDNAVVLSGCVDSWQEKMLCEKVTKGVKGVRDVTNNIQIEWLEERTDQEIEAEIKGALRWDALVEHGLIRVEVSEGKVILRGFVGSAAEKQRVYRDVHIHGVEYVDMSRLKVRDWARNNDLKGARFADLSGEKIENALKNALSLDPRVSSGDIALQFAEDGQTVTLRGTVDNLKAKRSAGQDARNTVGIRDVRNRIKVRSLEPTSDERVEDKVERALNRDPYVGRYTIAAHVTNGRVELEGLVASYFEKLRADDVASRVNGVLCVDNHLMVQKGHDPTFYNPYVDDWHWSDSQKYTRRFPDKRDKQIKKDIEDELWWSPFVDLADVTVDVDDGIATLTGTVDSWQEYHAAANNAYEGGAIYVDNDLVLK